MNEIVKNKNRRDFLKLLGSSGLALGASRALGAGKGNANFDVYVDGSSVIQGTGGYTPGEFPGVISLPNDVKRNNIRKMEGPRKLVCIGVVYPNTGGYSAGSARGGAKSLSSSFRLWSRGKMWLVGRDGTGDPEGVSVKVSTTSTNPGIAEAKSKTWIPSGCIAWFATKRGGSNAGQLTFDTNVVSGMVPRHECGHVLRLGHASSIAYNTDGTFSEFVEYGDPSSFMGNSMNANGYNLPAYHRLGWIEENEVVVFTRRDSGKVYRLRNVRDYHLSNPDRTKPVGIVYYLPVTGNRLWLSYHNDSFKYHENHWVVTDEMQYTYLMWSHKAVIGTKYKTCLGLTLEVLGKSTEKVLNGTTEAGYGMAWVDLKITYNEADDKRNLPFVYRQSQKLLRAPANGVSGQKEVTIEWTNNNPPTSFPVMNTNRIRLEVPAGAKEEAGTGSTYKHHMPGGTTQKWVRKVTSKAGPLSPADAVLKAKFYIAHCLPFEFDIDFRK